MFIDHFALYWAGRIGLKRQAILHLGHADVHRQRSLEHDVELFLGPLEHVTRGQLAHGGDKHGVGGAVHAMVAGREVHQGKQRTVGCFSAVTL